MQYKYIKNLHNFLFSFPQKFTFQTSQRPFSTTSAIGNFICGLQSASLKHKNNILLL